MRIPLLRHTLNRRVASITVALALAIPFAATAPVQAASDDPLVADCNPVEVVFARGSGQKARQNEAIVFFKEVKAHIGDVPFTQYELGSSTINGSKYPAVAVEGNDHGVSWFEGVKNAGGAKFSSGNGNDYGDSVDEGAAELVSYLRTRAKLCKSTLFVLGGYSQGAQVVGEAYESAKISDKIRERIIYNALFGDPKLRLPEGLNQPGRGHSSYCAGSEELASEWRYNVPKCDVYKGSLGARKPYLPEKWQDRTGLWCHNVDFVCGTSKIPWVYPGHMTYGEDGGAMYEAAREIAMRLKAALPAATAAKISDEAHDVQKPGTAGLDVVFLIDSTGSMDDRIEGAKVFASNFAATIKKQRGRVALVEFRDTYSTPAKILAPLDTDLKKFQRKLFEIKTQGAGNPELIEGQLHGLMKAFDGLEWRDGATKAAVILTDAGFKDPDGTDGSTLATVAARALEIDPVNVFAVVPTSIMPAYESLATLTTGGVIPDDSDSSVALAAALTRIEQRPVALIRHPEYFVDVNGSIRFDVSASYAIDSEIVSYDWDFDGDGTYELLDATSVESHVYPQPFDGVMQMRVTDSDGIWSNISAFVHVGTSPDDLETDAPRNVEATPTGVPGELSLSWDPAESPVGVPVDRWVVSSDGIPAGVVDKDVFSATLTDVERDDVLELRIAGMAEDGSIGQATTITLDATDGASGGDNAEDEAGKPADGESQTIGAIILPYVIGLGLLLLVALIIVVTVIIRRIRRKRSADAMR
jgi:Mg-chelatase subunit ChlD